MLGSCVCMCVSGPRVCLCGAALLSPLSPSLSALLWIALCIHVCVSSSGCHRPIPPLLLPSPRKWEQHSLAWGGLQPNDKFQLVDQQICNNRKQAGVTVPWGSPTSPFSLLPQSGRAGIWGSGWSRGQQSISQPAPGFSASGLMEEAGSLPQNSGQPRKLRSERANCPGGVEQAPGGVLSPEGEGPGRGHLRAMSCTRLMSKWPRIPFTRGHTCHGGRRGS